MRVEIKVEGQVITARFGILALRKYAEHFDLTLNAVGPHLQNNTVFGIADLFYFAYLSDCELSDRVPANDLTKDRFTDFLEELTPTQFGEITNAIHDIKLFGKKLSEMGTVDTKKKVTPKAKK